MDVVEVDERDSGWEIDAPRFRVFVFDSRHTTWCYDITGAEILEVARWAQKRCSANERYEVALVHDNPGTDGAQARGLVWLLGCDANTGSDDDVTRARLEAMHARSGQTIVLDE